MTSTILELCHYDDSRRTESLKRLRRLAAADRCHHIRHAHFVDVGVDAIVLFDAFCAFEPQPCGKAPCSENLSIFVRCNPTKPLSQELKMRLTLASQDTDLLQFRNKKTDLAQSSLTFERVVRPCMGKNRGFWPTSINAIAVRYPSLNENHVPVSIDASLAIGEKTVSRMSMETFFRIPRTNECPEASFLGTDTARSQLVPMSKELSLSGVEIILLQETFKHLMKDGYESVKKFFGKAEGQTESATIEDTPPSAGAGLSPSGLEIASLIKARFGEADQRVLLAQSKSYVGFSARIGRRVEELTHLEPGSDRVKINEDIERLRNDQRKVADEISETLLRQTGKAAS